MIVWLASYPRSGNTFFRILMNHLYQVQTYSVYDDALFSEIGAADVVGHDLLPGSISEMAESSKLYFVKTHDLPTDNNPAVYLVRDGRDAVVSHARYKLAFENVERTLLDRLMPSRHFEKVLKRVIEGQEFGGWSGNVMAWTAHRESGNTAVLKYEELIESPVEAVQQCLDQLSISLSPIETQLPSFDELHEKWPAFFRKGKRAAWKSEMSDELHKLFWQYHRQAMEYCGYGKE